MAITCKKAPHLVWCCEVVSVIGNHFEAVTLIFLRYLIERLLCSASRERTAKVSITGSARENGLAMLRIQSERKLGISPGEFVFFKTSSEEKHLHSVFTEEPYGSVALSCFTEGTTSSVQAVDHAVLEGSCGTFRPTEILKDEAWITVVCIAPFLA